MKALHVLHRICHYFFVWDFIIAVLASAFGLFYIGMFGASGYTLEDVGAMVYLVGMAALVLAALGVLFFALSHVFKMAAYLRAQKAAEAEECECGCGCCCCEKEEKSDLDAQVEEVMKWKNLYVEGIITEREFIDKRNEILRISK